MSSIEPEKTKPDFVIRFEEVSLAQKAAQARALREVLLDSAAGVEVKLTKHSNETMDLGSVLAVFLDSAAGAGVLIELAKGVSAYIARDRPAKLVIEADGRVIFEGNSRDAAAVAAAMQKVRNSAD